MSTTHLLVTRLPWLRAVAEFASTDTSRIFLNGVCVEFHKDHTIFVATDGRAIAALRADLDPLMSGGPENPVTFIIPSSLIKRTVAGDRNRVAIRFVHKNGRQWRINMGPLDENEYVSGWSIDANYPSWRQVVSTTEPITPAKLCIDPWLFGKLDKLASHFEVRAPMTICTEVAPAAMGETDVPVRARLKARDYDLVAVLMPFRDMSAAGFECPEWAKKK